MATLYDVIRYDRKPYTEVTDITGRQKIKQMVGLLKPLENEIANHPNGTIDITPHGYHIIDSFEQELKEKITNLLEAFRH